MVALIPVQMSSPMDGAMDVKKRRRMKALQEEAAKNNKPAATKVVKSVNLMDCDIGASPKLNPVMRKKGFHSPLGQARNVNLN